MAFMGDLLFDISYSRRRAWRLAVSIEGDVKSIEDATNSAIGMINGYLDVKRGPVDSRGKTINDFLAEVRQAFEDLEYNAKQKYRQLSTTIDTTIDTTLIDDLREEMGGVDFVNKTKWMGRFTRIPPKLARHLAAVYAFAVIVEELMESMSWRAFAGGIIRGGLGGVVVFSVTEALFCAIESKMLKGYIDELTGPAQTMGEIRKAFVRVADQLKYELITIQARLG